MLMKNANTMKMPKLRPVALFLLTLLGAGSIALGFRGKSHERYAEAKAKHEHECAAWLARGGAADVCEVNVSATNRPKLLPMYTETREQIRMARAVIAMGFEENMGVPMLGASLDVAMKIDRYGTPLAEMIAAALFDQVLDAIEGKPEKNPVTKSMREGTPPLGALPINTKPVESSYALRKILSGRELRSARRPLEGERLYALTSMTAMRDQAVRSPMFVPPTFFSATSADLMQEYSSVTRSMEASILKEDEAQCHRAAGNYATSSPRGPVGHFMVARFGLPTQVLCPKLIEVVRTAKRFEKVRRDRFSTAS
jgi:hypothetical protein